MDNKSTDNLLKNKADYIKAIKRVIEYVESCECEGCDCAGDLSVGIYPCPLWDIGDVNGDGSLSDPGCVVKKWKKELYKNA